MMVGHPAGFPVIASIGSEEGVAPWVLTTRCGMDLILSASKNKVEGAGVYQVARRERHRNITAFADRIQEAGTGLVAHRFSVDSVSRKVPPLCLLGLTSACVVKRRSNWKLVF